MGSGRDSRGSEELRGRLIEAAVELLREPDTPLDLRKVAERAGKSRTAPYLVFGKGEGGGVMALRIAVAAEGARRMRDVMQAAYRPGSDPFAAFQAVAAAFLAFVERNPRLFRLMYGPEINAIVGLGEGGFRDHPEFQPLLEHRDEAGAIVRRLIEDAQRSGALPADPPAEGWQAPVSGSPQPPSERYLQIAWATMIGVSVLREDDLLRAIGWDVTIEQGARLVAESVLGVDPKPVEEAARAFLSSPQLAKKKSPAVSEPRPAPESPARGLRARGDARAVRAEPPPPEPPPPEAEVHLSASMSMDAEDSGSEDAGVEDLHLEVRDQAMADEGSPETELTLSETLGRYSGLRRAAYAPSVLRGAQILWIDDHPAWVASVAETLRQLGAHVDVVPDTRSALRYLSSFRRDASVGVILSDIARGGDPQAGTRAIPELRAAAPGAAIIFHIADFDPERGVPKGAFGITSHVDELLHLVLDALEGREG